MLKGPSTQKYSPELRAFALSLAFFSPRTYELVRTTFNKSLPHLRTISKWYTSVDGSPGFTNESLLALKSKTVENKNPLFCNLVMDEISIRKRIEWDGTRFTGFIDVGGHIDSEELPEAREAIVFLLVCLNQCWKVPVGYFLTNGLSAGDKAQLIKKCLEFVHQADVVVTSLTFDGAASNISAVQQLGAELNNPYKLKTFFRHPVTEKNVYVFLDICHMVKLLRNCFGALKTLKNSSDEFIKWEFVSKLVEVQNFEGLHAATKLRNRHLQWSREIMKVRLAVQTISRCVSDAITFLRNDLKHPEFAESQATSEFILNFNNLFDIFNSRGKWAKYKYKQHLSKRTESEFLQFFQYMKNYILGLTLNGQPVVQSKRKTGFLGFLVGMESLEALYRQTVIESPALKYIATYRLSQDHLELFFGAIRSKGGFNNNPTARQFQAAYKRLLVHTQISGSKAANIADFDNITILNCSGITRTEEGEDMEENEDFIQFERKLNNDLQENNYLNSESWNLTLYVEDVVAYISGFVVRKIKKCINCPKCMCLLEGQNSVSHLQERKTYGRLVKASQLIIEVCRSAEKMFRFFLKTENIFSRKIKVIEVLIVKTMNNLDLSIYDHFYDGDAVNNHASLLIKLILKHYFKIRLHHETNKILEKSKPRVRSIYTKVALFRNE